VLIILIKQGIIFCNYAIGAVGKIFS